MMKGICSLALACALAAVPAAALAGPPYQTDDPEPTAYRHYEIYVFSTYENQPQREAASTLPSLEVNYGVMPNVQFSVTLPFTGARDARTPFRAGFGDAEVALKVRFVQEASGHPQISFYPSVTLPTGGARIGADNGLPKVFLPLWAQKTNGAWTFFGGAGVWHNPGEGNRDYVFTGIAASKQVSQRFSVGAELYHQTAEAVDSTSSTGIGIGFTQARGDRHALLASFGRSLRGSRTFTAYTAYALYLGPK